jgi:hypothetical protein
MVRACYLYSFTPSAICFASPSTSSSSFPANHLVQKIPRKPGALLKSLLEPLVPAVIRVSHGLRLARAAVLPEQHDSGLGAVRVVVALEALQVGQVGLVHGEDVVKGLEVGWLELLSTTPATTQGGGFGQLWRAVVPSKSDEIDKGRDEMKLLKRKGRGGGLIEYRAVLRTFRAL